MAKKELSTGAIVGIALGSTLLLAGGTYLIVKAINKSGSNRTVTPPSNTGSGGGSGSSSDKKGGFWNEAGEWIDRGLEVYDRLKKDEGTQPAEGKVNTGGDDDGVKVVLRNGVFMPSNL